MEKTIQVLQAVLQSSPDQWETRRHLAELLFDLGRDSEARALVSEAPSIPEETDAELYAAQALLGNAPNISLELTDRTLAREPGNARAYQVKAWAFQQLGDEGEARRYYTTATTLSPNLADPEFETWLSQSAAIPMDSENLSAPESARPTEQPEEEVQPEEMSPPEQTDVAEAAAAFKAKHARPQKAKSRVPSKLALVGAASPNERSMAVSDFVRVDRNKRTAISVFGAGLVHAALVGLFIFWFLKPVPPPNPSLVLQSPSLSEEVSPEMKEIQQLLPLRPSSSSASRAQVIAAETASPIPVPEITEEEMTDEVIGAGDTFGMGSGWGEGSGSGGGGFVQFFGDKQPASRVVYLVDFSHSMAKTNSEGVPRIDVLKEELKRSINELAPTMKFNIIYFSGSGWIEGESPLEREYLLRLQNSDMSLSVPWISASRANKNRISKEIDQMPLANQVTGGGTRWLPPLNFALNMQLRPDLIYLLTDGDAHDRDAMVSQLETLVPKNIPIHPISLELPGTVSKVLIEVAERTGGEFSLVYNGKLYTGKRAEQFTGSRYDPEPED